MVFEVGDRGGGVRESSVPPFEDEAVGDAEDRFESVPKKLV
jgi:hypothetical protein